MIEPDRDFRLVNLAILGQPHCVGARQQTRALRTGEGQLCSRRHPRRLAAHAPDHTIQPAPLARRQGVDDLAAGIEHFELELAEQVPRFLVVGDNRALRRIVADEYGVAIGPAAVGLDPLLHRTRGDERRFAVQQGRVHRTQRRDVVDNPDAPAVRGEHEIVGVRLDRQIAHRDVRHLAALELRPAHAGVDRDVEPELRAHEQQAGILEVFLDDVGVAAYAFGIGRRDQRGPGPSVIRGLVDIGRHVAERVPVERGVGRTGSVPPGFDPAHPRVSRQVRHFAGDVRPGLAVVARELQIAVVGADPDGFRFLRRFADRVDRRVHFRRRVVDGHAAALLLPLLLRIVGAQVRRDALPGIAVIARAEKELRADVERVSVGRRERDRRIPVEAQLLLVICLRLDVTVRQRVAIDAADVAALILRVDVIRIAGVGEGPEAVAAEEIFPAVVGNAARIFGVADPA